MHTLKGFERFTQTGGSFVPKLSIRQNGQIAFNRGAVVRFGLNKYKYVLLYYNPDSSVIAIERINNGDSNGAMRIVSNKSNTFVSGKAFLNYYGIDYKNKKIRLNLVENIGSKIIFTKSY